MTLWELAKNQKATVIELDSSLNSDVIHRLREMGVDKGREIECLRRGPIGGPIVLQLGGSVFAIEHELATNIAVTAN